MSGLLLGMTPDGEDGTDEWNQADTNQVEERIGGETSFAARLEAAAANQGTGEDEGNQPKRAKSSSEAKYVDGGGAEGQPSVSYFPREWRSTRGEGTGAGHVPVAWKPAEPTPRRDTQTTRRTPVPFRKNTTMANGRKGGDGPSLAIDPSSRDTAPTWKPKADPTSSFAFPSSPAASPMRRERKGSEAMFSPYRRLRPTPSMETRAPTSPGYASWRQATLGRTNLASPRAGTATPIAVTTGKRRRVEDGGNDAHRPPASRLRLGVSAIDTHATPRRMETAGTPIDLQGPASTPSTKRAGFGDISTDTARRILMTLDSLGKTASGTLAPETDAGRPTPVDFSKTFQKLSTPLSKTTMKERPPPVDTLGTLAQDGPGTEQEGGEVRASRERLAAEDQISLRGGKVTEGEKRAPGEAERTVPMDRSVEAKPSDDAFPVFTFRSPVPEPELERLADVGASDGIPAPVFAFGTNGTPAATPAGTDQSVPGSPTDIARANAQAAAAAASPLPMADADDEGEEEGHEEEVPQKGFSTGIRTPTPPRLSTGLDFLKKTAEDAKAAADVSAKAGTKPTGPASGGKGLGTDAAKANGGEGAPISFKWGAPTVDVDEQKGREGEAGAQAKKGGETPTKAGSFFQFGASPAQAPTVGFVFGKTETSFPNIGQKKDPAEKATGDGTAEEKEVRQKEDAPVPEVSGGWDASFLKKNEEASQAAVNAAKEEINKASGSPPGTSGAAPLFSLAPPKDDADAGATPAPIFVFGQGRAGDQKGLKQDGGQGVAKAPLSGFPGGTAGNKQEDAKPASSGFPAFKFAASAPGGFVFGSAPSTNAAAGVTENQQDSEAQPISAAPSTAPTFPTPKAPVSLAVDASTQPTDEEPPSPTVGVGHQPAMFKFGTQGGEDKQRSSTESDIPKPSATFTFGASPVNASTAGKAANPFVFGASPTATASPASGSTPAPPASGPEPGSRVSTQPSGTVSDQAEANATTRSGGFTFGASAGHPSSGHGGTAPAHEKGGIPPSFGAAAAPGAFDGTSSTSALGGSVGSGAFGAGTGTPAFGGVSAGPAFGAASAASTFGGGAATPIFGGDKGISGAPVFGSSGAAPAFGSVPGTSGFGGASTAPGFGAGASVSAFGGSASAGSFGGAQHAPSFGGAGAPFANANAPAPASPATGFGAGSSTPSFGGGAPAFGGGAGSAPGFGTSGSAPAFGASGSAPAFGASGSAPAFGASGSAPAFGASGSAPAFGAPSFGASGSTPGFGAPGGAPSFGGGASFPSNNPGSFPAGGGGFSMGSAGQPQPGQRRRIVKARRPARK